MLLDFRKQDFAKAILTRTVDYDVELSDGDGADLCYADFRNSNLKSANLYLADLRYSNFSDCTMQRCNLCRTNLLHSTFANTTLDGASFTRTKCGWTTFVDVDLSSVEGLDTVQHVGPSRIGVDTLHKSRNRLPVVFLRGCGVPDALIEYTQSLSTFPATAQHYSCFISYSTADEGFASRLYEDFQKAGIRCWKWDHDARTGQPIWGEIDEAIRAHDRLVLIASKNSLKSPAVNREIERAIVQEDERQKHPKKYSNPNVLFPVRLDDYLLTQWKHERKVDVTKKVIADARNWDTDTSVYPKVLDKLVRDLKAN